jgi:nucleoside-diphosphate-sugar epimerase
MSEERLHVVFGAGQVGRALAARLAGLDLPVRVVSRHRPAGLASEVDWRAADATDPEAATDAARGAAVIYQCLNAPYTDWPRSFPPLQRGVLAAAERTGALLVSLENLYGYGPTAGEVMTEDLPRASDFFGAGITTGTTLGERVFANAVAGKRADFIGNPELPHTYSYVPDIATGLATLGSDERAVGGVWHLPGPETVTTRALLELVAGDVGHPVGVRSIPKLAVRALGVFNPMMRELAEMSYQFDKPFVLDTTKYESTFGPAGTSLATAIGTTVAWYQSRNGIPHSPQESAGS